MRIDLGFLDSLFTHVLPYFTGILVPLACAGWTVFKQMGDRAVATTNDLKTELREAREDLEKTRAQFEDLRAKYDILYNQRYSWKKYVEVLHEHIDKRLPPPPPDWPDDLKGFES